jgi:hypothetical protein
MDFDWIEAAHDRLDTVRMASSVWFVLLPTMCPYRTSRVLEIFDAKAAAAETLLKMHFDASNVQNLLVVVVVAAAAVVVVEAVLSDERINRD